MVCLSGCLRPRGGVFVRSLLCLLTGLPLFAFFFQNEPFFKIKERIQKRIDVPDKEFEKVCEILSVYLSEDGVWLHM